MKYLCCSKELGKYLLNGKFFHVGFHSMHGLVGVLPFTIHAVCLLVTYANYYM